MRRPLAHRYLTAIALLLALLAPATAAAKRSMAVGTGGVVASETEPATQAGLAILRRGGTAADAAVAVASTLGVSDPLVAGIGGGGYFVYYDAGTRRVYTIDGRETAPAAASANLFLDPSTGAPLSFPTAVTSGLSVGVPGTLMTWKRALRRWGRFSLGEDLRPAERVARAGFVVTAALREGVRENAFRFTDFSSTKALFLPHGALPVVGSRMRNPGLARTYDEIGHRGVHAFYDGPIGAEIVRTIHHLPLAAGATLIPRPGLMTRSDLAHYSAPYVAPTHVSYRGRDVYSMAPSSSGGSTVGEALNILGTFDLGRASRVQALHDVLEASRLAFADRNRYVGDRRYVDVPLRALLSERFARQRACLIKPDSSLTSPVAPGDPFAGAACHAQSPTSAAQPQEGTNTNHFVVADKRGDVVSYTNTIEQLGGSAIAVPGRGFLLNNELTDFDFAPLQPGVPDPNLPAGGKRPRSSMSPTIVLRHRRPLLAVGAAGGSTIITTVLEILVNRFDFHMRLRAAIAAPRASQRNMTTTQAEPAFLASPLAQELEGLGETFVVNHASALNPSIGIAPTIGTAAGLAFLGHRRVQAVAEPTRRGGGAAGALNRRR